MNDRADAMNGNGNPRFNPTSGQSHGGKTSQDSSKHAAKEHKTIREEK